MWISCRIKFSTANFVLLDLNTDKCAPSREIYGKCVCDRSDRCGQNCLNRLAMLECDGDMCSLGPKSCLNRAFASFEAHGDEAGGQSPNCEVTCTANRGFGLRASRYIRANAWIMEYTGEIITEMECRGRGAESSTGNVVSIF